MKLIRVSGSVVAVTLAALVLSVIGAAPAAAQEYSLFDKFSIGIGASSLGFDTTIRLDATDLDIGTEIDFEKDLGLSSSEMSPSVSLQWRAGKKHLISARYDSADRNSTAQVATEIRFGDLVVPIDATVTAFFDVEEILLGYSYYPWVRDRWALGFGLGLRVLDFSAGIEITDLPEGEDPIVISESGEATGPLPFINLDYRYAMAPKWRLIAGIGWLDIELGDFSGSQNVLSATIEHLVVKRLSWGFGASYSTVDVDVTESDFSGSAKFDIVRFGLFAKARW